MSADEPRPGRDAIDDLVRRVNELEKWRRDVKGRTPHVQLHDFVEQGVPIPNDGQIMLDYTDVPGSSVSTHAPRYAYGGVWHLFNLVTYEWRLTSVRTGTLAVGDNLDVLTIPRDVHGFSLKRVKISITTVSSSGVVQVMLHNATTGFDMLSTHVHINQGHYSSVTATTAYVINPARKVVSEDDRIRVDVDSAGTGVKGLSMKLDFVEVD